MSIKKIHYNTSRNSIYCFYINREFLYFSGILSIFVPYSKTAPTMNDKELVEYIDHDAIVVAIDPAHNIVKVRIDDSGECGSCPASAICHATGEPDNLITIYTKNAVSYRKNDIVTVRGTEQMHRKAIMYATVLPSIAMVAVMVAVYILTLNQLAAALTGIGVMIFFFILLYLARNKMAHEFSFTIVGKPERAGEGV